MWRSRRIFLWRTLVIQHAIAKSEVSLEEYRINNRTEHSIWALQNKIKQSRLWVLMIKKNYIMLATKFRLAAILRGYIIKLVENDPKIPKHNKVVKDTMADKEKEIIKLVENDPKIPKHNKVVKDTMADKEKEKLHEENKKSIL